MVKIRNVSRCLALLMVLALLLTAQAVAAESGALWLCASVAEEGVTAKICADTAVASGVITVTYDKRALTFREVTMDETAVAMHAVNSKVPGRLVISWVAPAGYSVEEYQILMQIRFEGTDASSISLSGSGNDLNGEAVAVTALDFTGLNTALAEVEGKLVQDYTPGSFDAMLNAEKEARELLEQEIVTPSQLAAATEKVETALAQLEPKAPPTVPATTAPAPQPNGNGWIGIAVAAVAVCAAVAVAVVVIIKKRGSK